MRPLTFKLADEPWEMEEIGRLLYRTFVEEIPQHPPNPERTMTDKFHQENVYQIALDGPTLAGMMAIRDRRPFSLDGKLADLDGFLPPARRICELRLLAVRPEYRCGRITQQLLSRTADYCIQRGFNLAVISGTTRQLKLYSRMGFVPFGPLVGAAGAWYQPMYLTLERFQQHTPTLPLTVRKDSPSQPVNLLPGPTAVAPEVAAAFLAPPFSHRNPEFLALFGETRALLCDWTGARHVAILAGSGTLANDLVAAQISRMPGRGLLFSNGEFGERLLDHAERMGLAFDALRTPWGQPLDYARIETWTARHRPAWLWFVHCETSTGFLNDLNRLADLAQSVEAQVCVDCVSSLGTVPLDLRRVHLASAVSGKALGSYPGLALVFHDGDLQRCARRVPRYLDLTLHQENGGVPFTLSSNQLCALSAAVQRRARRPLATALGDHLRAELGRLGLPSLAPPEHASPAVFTLPLPPQLPAESLAGRLEEAGLLVAWRSRYLRERNWMQLSLFSDPSDADLDRLVAELERILSVAPARVRALG